MRLCWLYRPPTLSAGRRVAVTLLMSRGKGDELLDDLLHVHGS
jgi:hypothetical protein